LSGTKIELEGKVREALPAGKFKVEIPNGKIVLGHPSGRMRQNFIKIVPGDLVTIEVTATDTSIGRITFRGKKK